MLGYLWHSGCLFDGRPSEVYTLYFLLSFYFGGLLLCGCSFFGVWVSSPVPPSSAPGRVGLIARPSGEVCNDRFLVSFNVWLT